MLRPSLRQHSPSPLPNSPTHHSPAGGTGDCRFHRTRQIAPRAALADASELIRWHVAGPLLPTAEPAQNAVGPSARCKVNQAFPSGRFWARCSLLKLGSPTSSSFATQPSTTSSPGTKAEHSYTHSQRRNTTLRVQSSRCDSAGLSVPLLQPAAPAAGCCYCCGRFSR